MSGIARSSTSRRGAAKPGSFLVHIWDRLDTRLPKNAPRDVHVLAGTKLHVEENDHDCIEAQTDNEHYWSNVQYSVNTTDYCLGDAVGF